MPISIPISMPTYNTKVVALGYIDINSLYTTEKLPFYTANSLYNKKLE
jgi:hypothetical protein